MKESCSHQAFAKTTKKVGNRARSAIASRHSGAPASRKLLHWWRRVRDMWGLGQCKAGPSAYWLMMQQLVKLIPETKPEPSGCGQSGFSRYRAVSPAPYSVLGTGCG